MVGCTEAPLRGRARGRVVIQALRLTELVTDAWRTRAPAELAGALDDAGSPGRA